VMISCGVVNSVAGSLSTSILLIGPLLNLYSFFLVAFMIPMLSEDTYTITIY